MNKQQFSLPWSPKKVLSCSTSDIMSGSNISTVIMAYSQQRLSKTTLLLVIKSNLFVVSEHIGRTESLSITLVSSQLAPIPCCFMHCKCGQMLLLQSSGAMLFCTHFIYTTAPHGQMKWSPLSLSSLMKIWITHQMISKCSDHQFMFSTWLYSLALSVLENGKRDPTRVYMLDICHTMWATSSSCTTQRLNWYHHNTMSFMMNHLRLFRSIHLKQRCNENWTRCWTLCSSPLNGYTVMHIPIVIL